MAGTADSPCRFTNLRHATDGDTLIVAYYGSSDYVDSDDRNEWAIVRDTFLHRIEEIRIWDKRPNL